jgi:hypothetical protein
MTGTQHDIWKYCYWLNQTSFAQLQHELADKNISMVQAHKNPCEALRGDAGYAEPATWSVICKHDAAPWYRASRHAGETLVVTSFPLSQEYAPFLETTIEESNFEPIDFPPEGELFEMANSPNFRARIPEGWVAFPKEMGEAIVKGLNNLSEKKLSSFGDLLARWDAVHANFAEPRYRAGKEFMHAPYSVADSTHIGTCCVELFNLLGTNEDALLVRPCIGSVIVRVLEKNRYYLVRLAQSPAGMNRLTETRPLQ